MKKTLLEEINEVFSQDPPNKIKLEELVLWMHFRGMSEYTSFRTVQKVIPTLTYIKWQELMYWLDTNTIQM